MCGKVNESVSALLYEHNGVPGGEKIKQVRVDTSTTPQWLEQGRKNVKDQNLGKIILLSVCIVFKLYIIFIRSQ